MLRKTTRRFKLSEVQEEDGSFLGIVSPKYDYQLAFELNCYLHWNLVKSCGLIKFMYVQDGDYEPDYFIASLPELETSLYLLENRQYAGLIVPALKQFDYFIVISGSGAPQLSGELKSLLLKSHFIENCYPLEDHHFQHINISQYV